MLDGISRWTLLALSLIVCARSFYLLGQVKILARRIALIAIIPPSAVWAFFYVDNLANNPWKEGGLPQLVVTSRVAVFLTIIAWIVKQQVIVYAESATRRVTDES